MTHCRMCSQRLTRPGKLCRECERELQRARTTAASVDTLSAGVPLIDAARMATTQPSGWARKFRSRPTVLVAAFSVGIATAATLHVAHRTEAAGSGSVMIDRDLRNVTPRDHHAAAQVPARGDVTPASSEVPAPQPAAERRTPVVVGMAATGSRSSDPAPSAAPSSAAAPPVDARSARGDAPSKPAYDRVLGLAAALDDCSNESLFARIACEHRARAHYCEGAAARQQIPQCAEMPLNEHRH